MDKKLRTALLKSGGKKAVAEYNQLNRVRTTMNTGTRVHPDLRYKKPKYKKIVEE